MKKDDFIYMQQIKPLQAVTCKFPEPNEKQAQQSTNIYPWNITTECNNITASKNTFCINTFP